MMPFDTCLARPCRVRFGTTPCCTPRIRHTGGHYAPTKLTPALPVLNCNMVISRNVRRGPRAFPRGGGKGNAGVRRHFCRPRIIIDSLLSTASSDRVYTYTCVCVCICVRARSQVYVALYTNRKSEAITRYGTDKAGLTYLAGSLKRIKYRARPLIQRAYYPRLELFLR